MTDDAKQPESGLHGSVLDVIARLTGEAPRVELRREDSAGAAPGEDMAQRAAPLGRGNYRLLGEIARGGMGVVLRGRDQDLRRDVALKVLHAGLAQRPDSVKRFVEEAQISGQLQHPGIAPVYELGLLSDQRPYFSMKLIRGRTFADLLLAREESTSDRRRMLDIFASVCQTMAYVHSRGVIHRDLKPANVMVGAYGEVQVVDWGLAKLLARDEAPSTTASSVAAPVEPLEVNVREQHSLVGTVMGTLAYMPPEQARGEIDSIDERADVFALGAILCEILTGGAPYSGTASQVAVEAARGMLGPAFDELERAQADRELIELCERCLAPERENRPRDAREVVVALQSYFESLEQRARAAQIEAAESRVKAAEERRARKLTASLAASVVVTLLVAGGAWAWTRVQRERRESATREQVDAALAAAAQARATRNWDTALADIERARTALRTGVALPELAARVEQVAAEQELEAQAAQAERERVARNEKLLATLEEARTFEGQALNQRGDLERQERQFVAAFREWGVDVDAAPQAEVVEFITRSGAAPQIAAALDEWVWRRVILLRGWHEPCLRLIDIAAAIDPAPARQEIRRALAAQDEATLLRLAEQAALTPLDPATAEALAVGLLGFRQLEPASKVLLTAVDIHPGEFALQRLLAFVLHDLGPERRALAKLHYNAAFALRPTSASALHGLAAIAHEEGDAARAEALYRRALEYNPRHTSTWNDLATVVSDPAEQERCLRKCLELSPDSYEPKINLGRLLHMSGREKEAVPLLREAVAAAPWAHLAWNHLGTALGRSGDRQGAIAAFRRAIEIEAGDVSSLYNLALELRALGQLDEALEFGQRAQRLIPEHPLLNYGLGDTFAQLGREREALEHFTRSLANDPQAATTNAWVARLCANAADTALRDLERALASAQLVLAQTPRQVDAALAKGLAHARRGEFEAALAAVDEAARIPSTMLESLELTRALALCGLERRDEARAVLEALGAVRDDSGDAYSRRERDRLLEELRAALAR
ncbi:MAG: protein kinase [Planctomycetes bacterium]|nr:protein kinase [Planctomycetota bacterium]